ncbi:MAG: cysteine hydrolase family protein [Nitrososphaerales archaeon]
MSSEIGVNYGKSVLIVWDMQHGIASRAFNLGEVVANTNLLIQAFHRHDLPVIFSQQTKLPYEYQSRYSVYLSIRRGQDPKTSTHMAEGTESWQLLSEIVPAKDDLVLKKHTPDFFIGTILEQVLRSKGVETLILTGVSTEVGIEATVRHGAYLGFIPVVSEDAVGSADKQAHEASLEVMRKLFEVKSTKEIIQKIE